MPPRLWIIGAALALIPASRSLIAQTAADDSATLVRRARLKAALAEAKARATVAAESVDTIVVQPSSLELSVGDSIDGQDLWHRLHVVGVTASGDSIHEFANTDGLEPNPFIERHDSYFTARRPGTAMLWIYIGQHTGPDKRWFVESDGHLTRVPIRVKPR